MMERIFSARRLLQNGAQRLQRPVTVYCNNMPMHCFTGAGIHRKHVALATCEQPNSFFATRSEFMWMTCTVLRLGLAGTTCQRAEGARHRTALLRSTEWALKPLEGEASSTACHTSSRCKTSANSVRCGNVLGCCLHCYAMA